jgi:MoaA/NifB/PqqE/SkfB family radical SAM enzyme
VSDSTECEKLSHSDFLDIIREVNNCFDADFELEGGEFFLFPEALKILRDTGTIMSKRMLVTTNGITEIGNDLMPYLLNLDSVRVSVESHRPDIQREIRGVGLNRIKKTISSLVHAGAPLVLRGTLLASSLDLVFDYVAFFASLGVRSFSFFEFQAVGRGESYSSKYSISEDALVKLLKALSTQKFSDEADEVKISLSAIRKPLLELYLDQLTDHGWSVMLKDAPAPSLAVNYDGMLSVCPWKAQENWLGRYHPDSFLSDIREWYGEGMLSHSCRHCSTVKLVYRSQRSRGGDRLTSSDAEIT